MPNHPPQGEIIEGVHHLPIRVYYEDTDFSGIVYHASYLRFMERGRTEFLRACGLSHSALLDDPSPLVFAVRQMQIGFVAPARIDDALVVKTAFTAARGARLEARQEVFLRDDLLIEAEVQIACLSPAGRPKRLPKALIDRMMTFLAQK